MLYHLSIGQHIQVEPPQLINLRPPSRSRCSNGLGTVQVQSLPSLISYLRRLPSAFCGSSGGGVEPPKGLSNPPHKKRGVLADSLWNCMDFYEGLFGRFMSVSTAL